MMILTGTRLINAAYVMQSKKNKIKLVVKKSFEDISAPAMNSNYSDHSFVIS